MRLTVLLRGAALVVVGFMAVAGSSQVAEARWNIATCPFAWAGGGEDPYTAHGGYIRSGVFECCLGFPRYSCTNYIYTTTHTGYMNKFRALDKPGMNGVPLAPAGVSPNSGAPTPPAPAPAR